MINKIINKIKGWLISLTKNDPVQHCELYRDKGCSHVDGILCNYPYCTLNKEYIEKKHNL